MKRSVITFLIAVLLLCACGQKEAPPEGAVARVGEEYIYSETIESDRLIGASGTDREIAEGKVLNMLMLLEAENLGLEATQDEIDEFMASQEKAWQIAGVQEQIEQLYAPLGISFDEYKQMVFEMAPNTIARQKLRNLYSEEYSENNSFDSTEIAPSGQMTEYAVKQAEYVDEQLQKLWSKFKGEYEFYID